MTTLQLVHDNYERLKSELAQAIERASEERSTVFQEWATGRVLLNAKHTEQSRSEQIDRDVVLVLDAVNDILGELEEVRLIPALTYDERLKHVVILFLRP